MPALMLSNVPTTISSDLVKQSFAALDPKSIKLLGGITLQITTESADVALRYAKDIQKTVVENRTLGSHTTRLPDGSFTLSVENFPPSMTSKECEQIVQSALQLDAATPVFVARGSPKTARIRLANDLSAKDVKHASDALKKLSIAGTTPLSISEPVNLKKPALILRKLKHAGDAAVLALFSSGRIVQPSRVQLLSRSPDVPADAAVAYFESEEDALQAASKLEGLLLAGKKISVAYKQLAEPAVRITNIPLELQSEEALHALLSAYRPASMRFDETNGKISSCRVVLPSPVEVDLATKALCNKPYGVDKQRLVVTEENICDIGYELSLDPSLAQPGNQLREALAAAGIPTKAISIDTNLSVLVGFSTQSKALLAQHKFSTGAIALGKEIPGPKSAPAEGGVVASHVSWLPAAALEVFGLDASSPATDVVASAQADDNLVSVIGVDRSAILKFRRHKEIVPNMKALKKIKIEGANVKPVRYRRLENAKKLSRSLSEYDVEQVTEDGVSDSKFDNFSLRLLLKDYMHADPATRYAIAKNSFETMLNDAEGDKDISGLLGSSYTPAAKEEAAKLLALSSDKRTPADTTRLFQLFLQREDMVSFVSDFRDMQAFFGKPDEEDAYDWSQFRVEMGEDIVRLEEELRKADAASASSMFSPLPQQKVPKVAPVNDDANEEESEDEEEDDDESDVDNRLNARDDDEPLESDGVGGESAPMFDEYGEKIEGSGSPDDPLTLTDKSGRPWSGVILDTDTVQKPMPGNRVLSHRCLVVIGNLRGTAGFGMGKGKNLAGATNAAFRDALRNLVHIDLYDNYGLAHDLHGKHNSCHAYIRATPSSRIMVASPVASAVLSRFGISSASVKLVGRRDPYAMVRALFNGLQKHINLEEYAKARGKRYLTLKWAYKNNV